MRVTATEAPHYEVEEVPMGRVYRWHPAAIAIECDCGEKRTVTQKESCCTSCGADYGEIMERKIRVFPAENGHPWDEWVPVEGALPC